VSGSGVTQARGHQPPAWRQHATGDRRGPQRLAEYLIRRACRRLPADTRDERYREWTAEIRAILDDPDTGPGVLRATRALRYAAGIMSFTRDDTRGLGARLTTGIVIYLAVVGLYIGLVQVFRMQGPVPALVLVGLAVCFDGFCLADLARAGQVRYLPKWGWVLACLVQTPFGGIMYLTTGRSRS
jgi:hypothetical protein